VLAHKPVVPGVGCAGSPRKDWGDGSLPNSRAKAQMTVTDPESKRIQVCKLGRSKQKVIHGLAGAPWTQCSYTIGEVATAARQSSS